MTTKRLLHLYLITLLCFLAQLAQSSTCYAADEIKIGAILGLGGPQLQYGTWASHGVEIAVEELNQRGGINGKKIKIVYEDTQGQAVLGVSAFKKLTEVDHVEALLTNVSSVAVAIAPLANMKRLVLMDLSSVTETYRTPHDYTFRVAISARPLATRLANYLAANHMQNAALLVVADEYGQSMKDVFEKRFREVGGSVVESTTFMSQDGDFRTQLLRVKDRGAQALVVVARFDPMLNILKQAKEVALPAQIVSDHYSVESVQLLKLAGANAEGVIYVAPLLDTTSNSTGQEFAKRYFQRFAEEPVQIAAQGHDGLMALAAAMTTCPPLDANCTRLALEHLSFTGVLGKIEFDEMGDAKDLGTIMKEVHQGKFELLP